MPPDPEGPQGLLPHHAAQQLFVSRRLDTSPAWPDLIAMNALHDHSVNTRRYEAVTNSAVPVLQRIELRQPVPPGGGTSPKLASDQHL